MLFEMATGNFTFRLQNDAENNELDELTSILNTAAEKMELLASSLGYITPHYTYEGLMQATIVLDKNHTITGFCTQVPILLEHSPESLFKLGFHEILAKQSIPLWEVITSKTAADVKPHTTLQLLFITSKQQLVPSYCTVSRLLYSNTIIISCISTTQQDVLPETTAKLNVPNKKQSDAILIQNVRAYILENLENLENPLPSTPELSKMFKVNEFKLKDSFRHFFNTSIYQFYIEERLKKAHLMILQTAIPIKQISIICGYIDYTNFYKAFKKRFGYPPSELKRDNGENTNIV
jgi:AraC-like DNA-binding protein